MPDPLGIKRIHPVTVIVRTKLAIRELSRSLMKRPSWRMKTAIYFRAKRSKSAIWRSISSRAESEAERMP